LKQPSIFLSDLSVTGIYLTNFQDAILFIYLNLVPHKGISTKKQTVLKTKEFSLKYFLWYLKQSDK